MFKFSPGEFVEPPTTVSQSGILFWSLILKTVLEAVLFEMARLEGFEPPTNRFEADYSIQLSYRRSFEIGN